MSRWSTLLLLVVFGLAACAPAADEPTGPRLVSEVTLAATATNANQVLAAQPVTPEGVSPLQQVTVDAVIVVTPTLPPSKTPTQTPTVTPTLTVTPTATLTATATQTTFLLPTSEIIAVTDVVAAPALRVCDSQWFFIVPQPASCPLAAPNAAQAVYQEFENGYMVWVSNQDAVYVMYSDAAPPRWEAFRDFFNEGMVEDSSEYVNAPSDTLWQPRRGFGLLWRDNTTVRNRIGWATQQWELPYSVQVQTGNDGSIYISRPTTGVFSLFPDGNHWQIYGGDLPGIGPVTDSGLSGIGNLP